MFKTRATRATRHRFKAPIAGALLSMMLLSHAGCFKGTTGKPFYGRIVVPQAQLFRWSDGGLPQTFDPAFAAAPPDTDLVRALFEGLTEYNPRTLTPIPAVATHWESSSGGRVWTFYLREDARWSNGDRVTATDFVRSWERTARIGALAPHTDLLGNIAGVSNSPPSSKRNRDQEKARASFRAPRSEQRFGAEALSDSILRVRLLRADMSFPALVAHPVFRPVRIQDQERSKRIGPEELISNGAFTLARAERDRVVLQRAENYWGKTEVALEHVEFVETKGAEAALAAYRDGEVDAVSNAAFEPLAIKLLAPYKDFRRATYGALTYYSFNTAHAPFDDVRVREAMAIAIDRERISQDDMRGATEPARKFLPVEMTNTEKPVVGKTELLQKDAGRARELFAEAGFPDGQGFPKIRLLINRNEQQRQVSQAIAAMWRTVLNIETEIIMKAWDEYEAAIRAGEYDVVRRGLVMQTTDELTNIRLLFRHEAQGVASSTLPLASPNTAPVKDGDQKRRRPMAPIESEEQALSELRSIPIYFASSYALVKPYVVGFDTNVLDAPSLKYLRIETNWKQPESASLMWSR